MKDNKLSQWSGSSQLLKDGCKLFENFLREIVKSYCCSFLNKRSAIFSNFYHQSTVYTPSLNCWAWSNQFDKNWYAASSRSLLIISSFYLWLIVHHIIVDSRKLRNWLLNFLFDTENHRSTPWVNHKPFCSSWNASVNFPNHLANILFAP